MKTIRSIAVVIIIAFSAFLASREKVQGQQVQNSGFAFPAIGTYSNVLNYAVGSVNVVGVYISTYDTNGDESFYRGVAYESGTAPTNKYQLDQLIIVPALTSQLEGICTNTNPNIDKSKGIVVYVGCDIDNLENGVSLYDLFYNQSTIQLVKNSGGGYGVPDLSGYSTELGDSIPVYVPNLQWARVEVGYAGDTNSFEVEDVNYDPESDPIGSDGYLYLDTGYITNSSASTGGFWMKTTLFTTGTNPSLRIYNGDGNPEPELWIDKTNAVVRINGGYSGQNYELQSSSDLVHWTNFDSYSVSPVPTVPLPQFSVPMSSTSHMFFRTEMTNPL